MAYKLLSALNTEAVNRGYEETVSAPATGDWIILDDVEPGKPVTVGLDIGTGSGSVEFTCRTAEAIINGETINEEVWNLGTISATANGAFQSSVVAVRMVNASGTTTLTITP